MSVTGLHSVNLQFDGSLLMAVPAVHYRTAFAEHVNMICSAPESRPDAIAIELGPESASAAAEFIRQLTIDGENKNAKLPCMLGLSKKVLNTVSPGNNGGYEILALSSTDSIIEAVRCALELGVPLYAVDIEDVTGLKVRSTFLPDPALAVNNIGKYTRILEVHADYVRDDVIDNHREIVMASRLKTLLARHRRVLFTCGLAHWIRIRELISDPAIEHAPADEIRYAGSARFEKVIMHPAMALKYMDLYPAVTTLYENRRVSAASGERPAGAVDQPQVFSGILSQVYREYFIVNDHKVRLHRRHEDLAAHGDFEQLIVNMCLLKQQVIPDMATVLDAAAGVMSEEFCRLLAGKMMDGEWTSQEEFPGLRIIAPVQDESGENNGIEFISDDGSRSGANQLENDRGKNSADHETVDKHWSWDKEPDELNTMSVNPRRMWPPVDYLLTAIAVRGRDLSGTAVSRPRVQRFEGSLLDGVDVKATMRAFIRGDDSVYVYESRPGVKMRRAGGSVYEPTVFIFKRGSTPGTEWLVHSGLINFYHAEYITDKERLKRVLQERGAYVIGGVSFIEPGEKTERFLKAGINVYNIYGMMTFMPPSFTGEQEARWLENNDYSRTPIIHDPGKDKVIEMYHDRFGMVIDPADWETSLIRMAIPYASECVTVIAPDGYPFHPVIHEDAVRFGVRINSVPHSLLNREQLKRASRHYDVEPLDKDGKKFPAYAERLLGEKDDANRRFVPEYILNYGMKR